MKILNKNKILSDDQHGSWKKRSFETQLINTIPVHDLAVGLDNT